MAILRMKYGQPLPYRAENTSRALEYLEYKDFVGTGSATESRIDRAEQQDY